MYVAPAQTLMSGVILQETMVAGVMGRALIDSGATTSCCNWGWYRRYQVEIRPLIQDKTQVIGVGNTPIFVDGRTSRFPFEWKNAVTTASFLVVPTLIEADVILGMDLLQRLVVKTDSKAGVAEPTVLVSHVQPLETSQVPARKSVVFQVRNPFPGKHRNVLFEPSEKLPAVIRGTTLLGQGGKMYVRLENTSDEEQILNPDWEIGTVEAVEEELDYPRVEMEEAGLNPFPEELTAEQKEDLRKLLDECQDIFMEKDFKFGTTNLIEYKIQTKGPPFHQRQNPKVWRHEQEQLKEMLEQEIVLPSSNPWASPVVIVKKKRMTPCGSALISGS